MLGGSEFWGGDAAADKNRGVAVKWRVNAECIRTSSGKSKQRKLRTAAYRKPFPKQELGTPADILGREVKHRRKRGRGRKCQKRNARKKGKKKTNSLGQGRIIVYIPVKDRRAAGPHVKRRMSRKTRNRAEDVRHG